MVVSSTKHHPVSPSTMETDAGDFAINDSKAAAPVIAKAPSAGPAGPSFGLPPKLEVRTRLLRDQSVWIGRGYGSCRERAQGRPVATSTSTQHPTRELALTSLAQPFILLAKSARGASVGNLVGQATGAPGVYVFSELLELQGIKDVCRASSLCRQD